MNPLASLEVPKVALAGAVDRQGRDFSTRQRAVLLTCYLFAGRTPCAGSRRTCKFHGPTAAIIDNQSVRSAGPSPF